MNFSESTEFESLYKSMWKCKCGKMKKASVARFVIHGIEETLKLEDELHYHGKKQGKKKPYKPRKPKTFMLTYPKVRPCSSIHIRDRIVQRSLNDNVIYPKMTSGFIWDNMACQKGKGTTKAMDRLNTFLHRYYINNGNSNEGWVWQFDIEGYYRNMRHSDARACFETKLDADTVDHAEEWLQRQYPYDIGYEPGSQMVQILGISLLNPLDHFAKEKVKAKIYERYMDDGFVISNSKEFLQECHNMMSKELSKFGMNFHEKKTRIFRLQDGIRILGFTFRLTKTGKVIRILNPENVKHERKKLVRMAHMVHKGEMTLDKYWECYNAWRAHAELGNSYKLILRMNKYAKDLLKEGDTDDTRNTNQCSFRNDFREETDGDCTCDGGRSQSGAGL